MSNNHEGQFFGFTSLFQELNGYWAFTGHCVIGHWSFAIPSPSISMKTKLPLLLCILLPLAAHAATDLSTALQKGLFEEEANQNLPAAIQASGNAPTKPLESARSRSLPRMTPKTQPERGCSRAPEKTRAANAGSMPPRQTLRCGPSATIRPISS